MLPGMFRRSGGARICDIFHDHFAKEIGRMDPLHDLTEMDIHIAIKNAAVCARMQLADCSASVKCLEALANVQTVQGVRPALIVPEVSFEILVRRQIERLLFPSQKCLDSVYEEMQRLVPICSTPVCVLHKQRVFRAHVEKELDL
jgi:dynamin 1-like protein